MLLLLYLFQLLETPCIVVLFLRAVLYTFMHAVLHFDITYLFHVLRLIATVVLIHATALELIHIKCV